MARAAALSPVLGLCALLAACAPAAWSPGSGTAATRALPPAKSFARAHPQPPARANADIARDFLDLHFQLEGGSSLPVLTRFEEPVTVQVTGPVPPTLPHDLSALLARLRREAGIDIRQVRGGPGGPAHVTIDVVPRARISRTLPKAACFVVPNVSSLTEFRRSRRSPQTDWTQLSRRSRLAIFVPGDVSPQELRDCLHEELAQALGPLNDLYRLPDSVFNDDNVHTVLTGFDMLILRATYAPELRTGMSRAEVAARLPAILSRLNPQGDTRPRNPLPATPRRWIDAVETALGPGAGEELRTGAAAAAVVIARDAGWHDHRRGFSEFILGRQLQAQDPVLAQAHFHTALGFLDGSPGGRLHRALVASRMAAFEIARGDGAAALALLNPAMGPAADNENAALLATLMLLQAEALELEGRSAEARTVRLDSIGWARYGFGPDAAVRARMLEIAALRPPGAAIN